MSSFSLPFSNGDILFILFADIHDFRRQHGGQDRALLSFDLDADLRPAFHWNLKQLFVFVLAEYETKANVRNLSLSQMIDRQCNSTCLGIIHYSRLHLLINFIRFSSF